MFNRVLPLYCRAVILTVLLPLSTVAQDAPIRIDTGLLSGVPGSDDSVTAYKGIPYAAPPVGDLRWRPPAPPEAWDGVRPADAFGATCMQVLPPPGSFYQIEFFQEIQPMSEDCLYLNVWTAAESDDERRPVMVWIHGGALVQGSGSDPTFHGEALARKGVVLVTINYRLGPFGFLAHPDLTRESEHQASGNYGLLDQIAALEWVQRNIAAFGGDPDNVTVFGQSAGAMSVNALMVSPRAKGLFHRVIGQSGSAWAFGSTPTLADIEETGVRWAESLDAESIDTLRTLPAERLMEGQGGRFQINVDGWLLPDDLTTLFRNGRQHDVPLLAGSTSEEGTTLMSPQLTAEEYREWIQQQYGDEAETYLKLYPAGSDDEAWESAVAGMSDRIGWGARIWATWAAATGNAPAYLYYFDRSPPGRDNDLYGAFHSAELVYVFNTLDSTDRPWEPIDREVADRMASYWTNFATTGTPNGEGLPEWPPYDPARDLVMALGRDTAPHVTLAPDRRAFLDQRFGQLPGSENPESENPESENPESENEDPSPVQWTHYSTTQGDLPAPNDGNQQTATLVADIDGDGTNDFLIAERTAAPALLCYRRTTEGWSRYVVEDEALRIEAGSAVHDIDGDGDLDVVFGGDGQANQVWWWENPSPSFDPGQPWTRHLIKTGGANKHHDQIFGDFDGDGQAELVFWNQGGHGLFLAEIPDDPRTADGWPLTEIYTYGADSEMQQRGTYPGWKSTNEHEGLAAADIDGDGTLDIVGGGRWFRHEGDTTFSEHLIDAGYTFTRSAAGQFIEGGRPEVVLVAGDGAAPLMLYEWQDGTWTARMLVDTVQDGHSIEVVDFNGDGHLDVFNAEMQLGLNINPRAYVLLGDGTGGFTRQDLLTGFGLHEARMVDLDGDNDLDILGKPYTWEAPRLDIWLQE